uniref:Uncharacterized protein n=1 Tax=Solanum tuberosum TaxID=4113 RepID=M1DKW9_SOLTU
MQGPGPWQSALIQIQMEYNCKAGMSGGRVLLSRSIMGYSCKAVVSEKKESHDKATSSSEVCGKCDLPGYSIGNCPMHKADHMKSVKNEEGGHVIFDEFGRIEKLQMKGDSETEVLLQIQRDGLNSSSNLKEADADDEPDEAPSPIDSAKTGLNGSCLKQSTLS